LIDDDGNIKTLAVLDRETRTHYWLTVYAMDRGAVPLSSKIYVYVEVLNVNDNVPLTLAPVYFASVAENARPFTRVVAIQAEDADAEEEGSRLTYEIIAGDPQSLFHCDPNTGIVSTTRRALDRETQAEHVLEVLVSDNGKPEGLNSTTRIVVTVDDENDNAPEFLERYYKLDILETIVDEEEAFLQNDQQNADDLPTNGSVANASAAAAAAEAETISVDRKWEELFVNSTWDSFDLKNLRYELRTGNKKAVFRAIAVDLDAADAVAYKMKSGAGEGKFQIDPVTGVVYAVGNVKAGEHYEMLIRASDSNRTALSRVSIKVRLKKSKSDPCTSQKRWNYFLLAPTPAWFG
jgi:hypothetical protein